MILFKVVDKTSAAKEAIIIKNTNAIKEYSFGNVRLEPLLDGKSPFMEGWGMGRDM